MTDNGQLCNARTKSHSTRSERGMQAWDEEVLLPSVPANAEICFTVAEQCSLGRDNFLGQAVMPLTPQVTLSPVEFR